MRLIQNPLQSHIRKLTIVAGNEVMRLARPSRLYVLCHSYTVNAGDPDSEETNTKNLYYSLSEEECEEQISHYRSLEGFRDYPDGFGVLHIELNTQYWESGFCRW